jgi:hypothetical protein
LDKWLGESAFKDAYIVLLDPRNGNNTVELDHLKSLSWLDGHSRKMDHTDYKFDTHEAVYYRSSSSRMNWAIRADKTTGSFCPNVGVWWMQVWDLTAHRSAQILRPSAIPAGGACCKAFSTSFVNPIRTRIMLAPANSHLTMVNKVVTGQRRVWTDKPKACSRCQYFKQVEQPREGTMFSFAVLFLASFENRDEQAEEERIDDG